MATESADGAEGAEVTVTLPPELAEWLDDRAADLEVDREELLVQLAGTYRAAADLQDPLADAVDGGIDDETLAEIEERLSAEDEAVEAIDDRVEDLEADLEDNVEDLRNRVLQLRDVLREHSPENHTHREFESLESRLDDLAETLETVADDVDTQAARVDDVASRLDESDEKLTRVARAVVSLRAEVGGSGDGGDRLDDIRRTANREGISDAACGACGSPVTIGLLVDPVCPHCETGFYGLDAPAGGLGRALGFRRPQLSCSEPPALESGEDP